MKALKEINVPADIIKKYEINLLIIFGSYVDGSNTDNSDLDLAYMSKILLGQKEELCLLEDMVKHYRIGRLDLINLRKASPTLKYEVSTKGKLLYGTEIDFLKFQLYAAGRYADSYFLRKDREEYLKKRLSKL